MGKRKRRARQASMWVATQDLPRSAAHPFYRRLNRVLDEAQFDAFVEGACATFYAEVMGRPSLAPGRYFRLLLLGYFEGLSSSEIAERIDAPIGTVKSRVAAALAKLRAGLGEPGIQPEVER